MRRDDASRPFTKAEFIKVKDAAYEIDDWHGHLIEFFGYFGPHPSVIPGLSSANLEKRPTDDGDAWFIKWIRAKSKTTTRPFIEWGVPQEMMEWLPRWLDQPKPQTREAYYHACKRVEKRLSQGGYHIKVNPLRLRHYVAVEMLAKGFPEVDVQAALGIDVETLRIYGQSTPEQRAKRARELGYGA